MARMKRPLRPRRPRKKVSKPSTAMVKIIKQVVTGAAEKKICFYSSPATGTNFDSPINLNSDCQIVFPDNVQQGTGEGERIGNRIKLDNINIKGHFSIFPNLSYTSNFACRVGVRMMIVTPHLFPTYPQAFANNFLWQQYLLQRGNNAQGFAGNIEDLYLPINRDMCSVQYDKVTYVTQSAILSTAAVGQVNPLVTEWSGLTKFFNINVKCKNKIVKYESNGLIAGSNYGPVLLIGYAFLDGSTPDVLTSRLTLWRVNTCHYTDI